MWLVRQVGSGVRLHLPTKPALVRGGGLDGDALRACEIQMSRTRAHYRELSLFVRTLRGTQGQRPNVQVEWSFRSGKEGELWESLFCLEPAWLRPESDNFDYRFSSFGYKLYDFDDGRGDGLSSRYLPRRTALLYRWPKDVLDVSGSEVQRHHVGVLSYGAEQKRLLSGESEGESTPTSSSQFSSKVLSRSWLWCQPGPGQWFSPFHLAAGPIWDMKERPCREIPEPAPFVSKHDGASKTQQNHSVLYLDLEGSVLGGGCEVVVGYVAKGDSATSQTESVCHEGIIAPLLQSSHRLLRPIIYVPQSPAQVVRWARLNAHQPLPMFTMRHCMRSSERRLASLGPAWPWF